MESIVNDLRYAQATEAYVDVYTLDGQKIFTRVHEVDEGKGFVSLYDPQHHGDATTTRKVQLELVTSVVIHGDVR